MQRITNKFFPENTLTNRSLMPDHCNTGAENLKSAFKNAIARTTAINVPPIHKAQPSSDIFESKVFFTGRFWPPSLIITPVLDSMLTDDIGELLESKKSKSLSFSSN